MKKKNIELDVDNFRSLVEDALDIYSDSVPYVKEKTLNFEGSRNKNLEDRDEIATNKPDWISECHPIRATGRIYGYYRNFYGGKSYGKYQTENLSEPIQAPYNYDFESGNLTVAYDAIYKIRMCWRHVVEEIDGADKDKQFVVKTLGNRDQAFIKLCQAMFMIGVGRSRRAFTLNDLPIIMDASEIVQEGRELYKEVIEEELPKYQKFYLAYGT
jgi:hypothetical protein